MALRHFMDSYKLLEQIPHEEDETLLQISVLSLILDQLPDGLLIIQASDQIQLANRAARQILSIPLTGPNPPARDLVDHPHWKEAIHQPVEHLPFTFEMTFAGNQPYLVEISYLPGLGKMIRLQDIAHYRHLEKVKDEFVHAVSHDLRSPLTAILGYIGLIDRVGPVNEQQAEFIQRAQGGVETIRHTLDKLLELQRIESGMDSHVEDVPAQGLLQQAADAFEYQIRRRGQTLSLDLPDAPMIIPGNSIRLRQIFDNLIDNASKYTAHGGHIGVTALVEEGLFIVQVSDNGFGIPEGDMPMIFNQFYRGSNILDEANGAGLGLSIVKSAVENYQGRIWVESSAGKGSTFTVVLPTVDAELPSDQPHR
jgi:two-component system, OmpR family, phosphate regulon sensor histidine kinase PhoR